MSNLLHNADFEDGTWRETFNGTEYGEIDVPREWVAFWKEGLPVPHDPENHDGYRRPETKVIQRQPPYLDPLRIHTGDQAWLCFTFYGIHDAGLYQRIEGIEPGTRLRASAWAHAWSSQDDDPHTSTGVGGGPFFRLESEEATSDQQNFTFHVGIDPTGGTDPWSDSVIWGEGAHIYNVYAQVPPVEAVAEGTAVTVFLRSSVLWRFKHCDAYWDTAELVAVTPPPPQAALEIIQGVARVKELFTLKATGVGAEDDLRLHIEGGEVLRSEAHPHEGFVTWTAMALAVGRYTAHLLVNGEEAATLAFNVIRGSHGLPVEPPRPV